MTLRRPWRDEDFPLPKKPFRLPVVLSLEEITTFFESIASLKQRTILMTAYAAGLRLSEVVYLKVTDIDCQRMVIRANQGKNRKDRYVMLSPRLLAHVEHDACSPTDAVTRWNHWLATAGELLAAESALAAPPALAAGLQPAHIATTAIISTPAQSRE